MVISGTEDKLLIRAKLLDEYTGVLTCPELDEVDAA